MATPATISILSPRSVSLSAIFVSPPALSVYGYVWKDSDATVVASDLIAIRFVVEICLSTGVLEDGKGTVAYEIGKDIWQRLFGTASEKSLIRCTSCLMNKLKRRSGYLVKSMGTSCFFFPKLFLLEVLDAGVG